MPLSSPARATRRWSTRRGALCASPTSDDAPDQAAVHLHGGARHVAGGVGQQERGGLAEFIRNAVAAPRNRGDGARLRFLRCHACLPGVDLVEMTDAVGVDPSGNGLIDADTLRRE